MEALLASPAVLAILGLVTLLALALGLVVTRYKVAGPNEAFIITGRKGKEVTGANGRPTHDLSGQKVVMGGGVFVLPFVQQSFVLDLSSRSIPVQIRGAVSKQGIKLNLDGVAIVKVGGDEDSIRAAAQRFLTQQGEIERFTNEVLSGALRSIVGGLTVEEVIRDRAAFAAKVAEESESALTGQGLTLDTFQIQDVTDDGTYLNDLGRPEAARVQQEASIAEAESYRAAEEARIRNEQRIIDSKRALELRRAEVQAETDAAQAQAAAAGPLAQAAREQEVLAAQEQVAARRAALTERELETKVRKPADAERYRVEQEAEARRTAQIAEADARKQASIAEAEAAAQRDRLSGEAERERRAALAAALEREGEAEARRRTALAEAVEREGAAEAAAILAKGNAEAESMQARADAFKEYDEAAKMQMLLSVLPELAKEIAAPMGAIDKLTVISTDGAGAMPKQVTSGITQTIQMLRDATGVDLTEVLADVQRRAGVEAGTTNGQTLGR